MFSLGLKYLPKFSLELKVLQRVSLMHKNFQSSFMFYKSNVSLLLGLRVPMFSLWPKPFYIFSLMLKGHLQVLTGM